MHIITAVAEKTYISTEKYIFLPLWHEKCI